MNNTANLIKILCKNPSEVNVEQLTDEDLKSLIVELAARLRMLPKDADKEILAQNYSEAFHLIIHMPPELFNRIRPIVLAESSDKTKTPFWTPSTQ